MVTQAGQSVTFETSDGMSLEGVLHLPEAAPSAGVVVCHPHPQYGGDMHDNVVMAICRAALNRGVAALRFNFRGAGGSGGSYDGGKGEQEDVAAALAYLRGVSEVEGDRVALAGYSFGAAMALMAVDEQVKALALVSVPTSLGTLPAPAVACPTLLVSGDSDDHSDPATVGKLAEDAAGEAEVVIVPNVDHFWWGGEQALDGAIGSFVEKHLA